MQIPEVILKFICATVLLHAVCCKTSQTTSWSHISTNAPCFDSAPPLSLSPPGASSPEEVCHEGDDGPSPASFSQSTATAGRSGAEEPRNSVKRLRMASNTSLAIPPGYHPPLAAVTPYDHRAWIIIATALGLVTALLSGVIRATVRSQFGQKLGIDDILLAGGLAIAVAQEVVVLAATGEGLGKTVDELSPAALKSVEKSFYAANILCIFTLALCKLSVAWFVLRLTPIRSQQRMVYVVCWAIVVWMVLAVFLLALQCNLSHPWVIVGENAACTGLNARHVTIAALDIALEVALLLLVVYLVFDLQTASRNKVVPLIAFSFRLPLIAIIGLRLHAFNRSALNSDFSLGSDLYLVFTETQLNYSLISATIPIMRPFFNSLVTNYGVGNATQFSGTDSYTHHPHVFDRSLEMSVLKSGISRRNQRLTNLGSGIESRNHDTQDNFTFEGTNDVYVYHDEKESQAMNGLIDGELKGSEGKSTQDGSVDSSGGQRMYIRRDVQWVVHTEDAIPSAPSSPAGRVRHGKTHSRGPSADWRNSTGM